MKLAIELAKTTQGQTSPNPVVGAVVVKDGAIVGMGAHLKAGEAHAEVHALGMAGERATGATLYVTLEPCAHYGKTPPCAHLVVEKEVKRVVIASTDPNPLVAGKGIAIMKEAGVEVVVGVLEQEATALNQSFFHFIDTKLPFVTLKTATSLDGKTATYTGESKWITSEQARLDVHELRHQHDAILVGVNTVNIDNPSLTTRLPNGGKNPIRVILDTHLRIDEKSTILHDGQAPTWIIVGQPAQSKKIEAITNEFVRIIKLPTKQLLLKDVLHALGERGITSLFVEGGSTIHGAFLKEKLFNQVITYIAPKLIGGREAPTSFGGKGIASMNDIVNVEIKSVEQLGQDLKIVAVPKEGEMNVYGDY